MRKVVASFFMSLDGVVESPEQWHFPYFDDELGAVIGEGIAGSDAFLLGRRTYDEWAAFWPQQDPAQNPMAAAINGRPKYVVSRSLQDASWENSNVLGGELADEVGRLKQRPGKNIAVSGSATLVRSLIDERLLDELRIALHPVLLGTGARLFQDGAAQAQLELVESRMLKSGVLDLTYRSVS